MRLQSALVRVSVAFTVVTSALSSRPVLSQTLEGMACPLELNQYRVTAETYSGDPPVFVTNWRNASGQGLTQAFYDPTGSTWYGSVPTLTSIDGRARWRYAGIYVGCKKLVWYRPNGTIERVRPIFTTLYTEGTVEEIPEDDTGGCCSGCGSGGGGGSGTELMPVTSADYDPYYADYSADCGGTGEAPSSGTQYGPGDSTGGETVDWGSGIGNGGTSTCGTQAIVEYVCIDVWVDGVGWVEWGCGYVTAC